MPAYSPDFNPAKYVFGKLKCLLKNSKINSVFKGLIGTLSIDDEIDDDDELRREKTGSRTSLKCRLAVDDRRL